MTVTASGQLDVERIAKTISEVIDSMTQEEIEYLRNVYNRKLYKQDRVQQKAG